MFRFLQFVYRVCRFTVREYKFQTTVLTYFIETGFYLNC